MSITTDAYQIGVDVLPSRNLHIISNGDGSATLNRGNVGAPTQSILGISSAGVMSAGVSPGTGNRTNDLATMKKFDDEFLKSHLQSGWQKLPSGLIFQWMRVLLNCTNNDTDGFKSAAQSWPLAFPTEVYAGNVSHIGASKAVNTIFHQDFFTKTGFILATPFVGGSATFLVTAVGV